MGGALASVLGGLPQGGNYRELPINRKLDYRFTEHGPAHQSKTRIPPPPVPYIRKLPQASYPHLSEGRQNGNHKPRKLTKLTTWITALSNSMKLWAIPCRATQDGWVMVESSDKTWSIGGRMGMANHFSILALKPHEQYEKAKRYDTESQWWTPQVSRWPIWY